MCYCDKDEMEILADLRNGNVPDEALMRNRCWSQICRVRGKASGFVDQDTWSKICTERGYLLTRQNPRGF